MGVVVGMLPQEVAEPIAMEFAMLERTIPAAVVVVVVVVVG